jgi:hypothetical protein
MKNVTTLLKDILQTYVTGARNREMTVIGFIAIVIISIALIVSGLIKT